MHLLIDDERNLPGMDVIAKTAEVGLQMLCLLEWSGLYLDHDLGVSHSDDVKDGYDVLKLAFELGRVPKFVQLVTSNPVGRENMAFLLRQNGYESGNGIGFVKKEW